MHMAKSRGGRERLTEWMARREIGVVALSRRLGVEHGQVSRIVAGKRPPSLDVAIGLEIVTGIPVSAWRGGVR
jgi:plasmid maintenance system antidote protein VapI